MVLMKTKIYLLAAVLLAALTIVGCQKEKSSPTVDNSAKIVGEWHCAPEQYDVDVYVAFYADGAFDEYQRIGEGRYRHYNGTWTINKDILSGVYSDGESWGSDYTVSFADDTMTLTSTNESKETMTYFKETIPADVKSSAIEPFASRTNDTTRWF
jgi:uncharacterized protein (TIGR03066 family)